MNRKFKLITVFLFIFLLVATTGIACHHRFFRPVSAQDVYQRYSFSLGNITLVAGCSVEKYIKVKNPCDSNLHLKVEWRIISSDPEGITIDIPENVVIQKNSCERIYFTVDTDVLLALGDYQLEITLYKVTDNGNHYGQLR